MLSLSKQSPDVHMHEAVHNIVSENKDFILDTDNLDSSTW